MMTFGEAVEALIEDRKVARGEVERMRMIVEVVANADSEDCIGALDVDIPRNGHPRQWLREAAREALAAPAPSCAPGEVERLRQVLATTRDYIADAASGALTYEDSGDGFIAMAKEDLARLDAALSPQGLDAKEGGE